MKNNQTSSVNLFMSSFAVRFRDIFPFQVALRLLELLLKVISHPGQEARADRGQQENNQKPPHDDKVKMWCDQFEFSDFLLLLPVWLFEDGLHFLAFSEKYTFNMRCNNRYFLVYSTLPNRLLYL